MARNDDFALSRHARKRLRQRRISLEQLGRALLYPDYAETDKDDPTLMHAVKRFHHRGGSRMLRVVYKLDS